MSTTATVTSSDPFAALSTSTSAATVSSTSDSASADRFLKLLVTQLQNQDPLNPMDNSQMTSQMAQISTVNGITQLNTTVASLNTQLVQMQALQGASLVGREVTVQGSRLDITSNVGAGGFDLAGPADSVKVQVLNPAGIVVDTVDLGAETTGRHSFSWTAPSSSAVADGSAYTFKVVAKEGTNSVVTTPLMLDKVVSVTSSSTGVVLQTQYSGDVAYADVKAFN